MKTLADLNLVYPGREETERLYKEHAPRVAWLHARANFFWNPGLGSTFNDVVTFAKEEPEAQWLKTLFDGRPSYSDEHFSRFFTRALERDPNNVYALAHAGYHTTFGVPGPLNKLRRAAEGGHTFAQVMYGLKCDNDPTAEHWLVTAALQDEPEALWACANMLRTRNQDERTVIARGAALRQDSCMNKYAELEFTKQKPDYWKWRVRAASKTYCYQRAFMEDLIIIMHDYHMTGCDRNIVYAIGHSLCTVEGTAFCDKYETDNGYMPGVIEAAIQVYKNIDAAARSRVMMWMLIARRIGLYKDAARLIGILVWASRLDDDDGGKDAVAKKRKL